MPRLSLKNRCLRVLDDAVDGMIVARNELEFDPLVDRLQLDNLDDCIDTVLAAQDLAAKKRYFNRKPTYRAREDMTKFPKILDTDLTTDKEFLFHYRCTRPAFYEIVNMIKNHNVFIPKGKKKQAPPAHQLLVYLKFLGSQGNGAAPENLATHFGVGVGTAITYQHRSQQAILSLERDTVIWPDAEERCQITRMTEDKYRFPNCIGSADGTLLPLEFRPSYHGQFYLSRKSSYALTMLIVNDYQGKILYYHVGWPGSVHDNRVWRNCPLFVSHNEYFSDGEYLLGDSAYTRSREMSPGRRHLCGSTGYSS